MFRWRRQWNTLVVCPVRLDLNRIFELTLRFVRRKDLYFNTSIFSLGLISTRDVAGNCHRAFTRIGEIWRSGQTLAPRCMSVFILSRNSSLFICKYLRHAFVIAEKKIQNCGSCYEPEFCMATSDSRLGVDFFFNEDVSRNSDVVLELILGREASLHGHCHPMLPNDLLPDFYVSQTTRLLT